MARLAIAHVLALNLGPVPCLQPPATWFLFLLTVPVHCLSVQTRLTLALLKDRPCRSSTVPPRSSPTSFTVENSSGLPFSPLLAEPPLPLFLSPSARPSPSSSFTSLRRLSCRSRRRHLDLTFWFGASVNDVDRSTRGEPLRATPSGPRKEHTPLPPALSGTVLSFRRPVPGLARPSKGTHRIPTDVCFRSTADVHDKNSGFLLLRLLETVETISPSLLYPRPHRRLFALWI